MKYQSDMQEENSVIVGMEQRDFVRDQHLVETESEFHGLREKLKHE